MAKMEQLQEVWEAKDLDGVMSFFTDDYEMRILHANPTMKGQEEPDFVKEMVID